MPSGSPSPLPAATGFEWKTAATWLGEPLVHVAFGLDEHGRLRVARGVVAIGLRAVGGLAVGLLAGGFLAVGLVAGGLCSLGVVAVGGLFACGVNAFAPWAVGVVAIGWSVKGLSTLGWKALRGGAAFALPAREVRAE